MDIINPATEVIITTVPEDTAVSIRQKFESMKKELKQVEGKWMEIFLSTGLYNYNQFLKLTKTGKIMAKVYKKNSKYFFEVLLMLKGINKK